jgi:hypothetical protein
VAKYLLDSDVVIAWLRRDDDVVGWLKERDAAGDVLGWTTTKHALTIATQAMAMAMAISARAVARDAKTAKATSHMKPKTIVSASRSSF